MGKDWDKFKEGHNTGGGDTGKDTPYARNRVAPSFHQYGNKEMKNLQEFNYMWAKEAFRIAKPGSIMLCFGGTRTFHRIACGIEDAGWEIRDTLMWVYGSGFPKSHNIGKAVDKKMGNERENVGKYKHPRAVEQGVEDKNWGEKSMKTTLSGEGKNAYGDDNRTLEERQKITKGNTKWEGYGTALKPAYEPIIMAMKPKEGTYAENALKYKVAGLNIDGARVKHNEPEKHTKRKPLGKSESPFDSESCGFTPENITIASPNQKGRFPANLIHDGSKEVEECFPNRKGFYRPNCKDKSYKGATFGGGEVSQQYNDSGSASRYFKRIKYQAKASKKERNKGLEEFEKVDGEELSGGGGHSEEYQGAYQAKKTSRKNTHPTVKPLALMEYLVELTKMPNKDQVYLDPFIGSGTTAMAVKKKGRNYIGIEQSEEYCKIARARIKSIQKTLI